MRLLLKNLYWKTNDEEFFGDIRVHDNVIETIDQSLDARKDDTVHTFDDHFIYPGFINAHDHLEMNLYPKLGTPPYHNYLEWARDIYKPKESPVVEIEKVPIDQRLLWGGFKNLISGVTTVVHHNPWRKILGRANFPVKVLKDINWSHSLGLGKQINRAFKGPKHFPFVIHAAEGVDQFAAREISTLKSQGLLNYKTVIVHGIAISKEDIEELEKSRASLVWCPASNYFMFSTTAPIGRLKTKIRTALGSDSTMTGSTTLLDEMKVALNSRLADEKEIFEMVTKQPANIYNLKSAIIGAGYPADLLISRKKHNDYYKNLIELSPADIIMTVVDGKIRLCDHDLQNKNVRGLKYDISINGTAKKCYRDIRTLKKDIQKKVSDEILRNSALWNMLV